MKKLLLSTFLLLFATVNQFVAFAQNNGDVVSVNGASYKLKTDNLIANPGFEDGYTGWTDATTSAATLTSTNFSIVASGGVGNSKYLVGLKNEGSAAAGSIGTGWSITSGKKYYFSYQVKYLNTATAAGNEEWLKVSLTNNKTSNVEPLILVNATKVNGSGQWTRNEIVFTNTNPAYNFIVARFRWLNNRLGFDNFALHEVEEVVNVAALEAAIAEAQSVYRADATGAEALQSAIAVAQDYLSSESADEVNQAVTNLKAAITNFRLANATPENPLDVTHFIVNPGFDQNTPNGWKGIGVINYHVVEFYQRTFNMWQKIAGLPAGKYVLKAQGFERPKQNDGGAAYRAGTETISARFYAKTNSFSEKSSPFSSLYKHSYTGTGSSNGYVNTMAAAETFLSNATMYYDVTLSNILLNQGDTLLIGAKSNFQQSGYWALFDNFRLEYHGAYNASDLVISLSEQIVAAQVLLTKKIQNSVRGQLNTAITQSQHAIDALTLEYDDLSAAAGLMNAAIDAGNYSVAVYEKLQAVMAEALDVYETLSATKKQNLNAVLSVAQGLVDDLDATSASLNKSITDISTIIYKKIYVPTWMMGNVYNETNTWSITRSKQSRNWIVFWEAGYGEDPSVLADGNYRINIDGLLDVAERSYDFYADSLKFINRTTSKAGDYKMIIRLRYTRDWEATGSGVDDMIGLLTLTAWSAQVGGHTLAHEVAHCFQYQVHCDNNNQNGWMYGFGSNASGGNGWWEQCAQWQAFKVYPAQQFTDGRFTAYLNTAHKHILHEAPRYDNYFIHDYFTFKHGMDIIGRMWNQSIRPEDPVEAYKRITGINQSKFNDEMYERAARFATWDIPALRSYGQSRISSRPQPKLNSVGNDFWMIDAAVCLENYGYNVIKLNAPTKATTVTVSFEGKAGIDGFRKNYLTAAGWRYGFVALLSNGTRVYSDLGSANYISPNGQLSFDCPDNCSQLWLVVSGAPSTHWRHAWDDDDSNDEQWPYQVKFNNTNLLGYQNIVNSVATATDFSAMIYSVNDVLYVSQLPQRATVKVYTLTGNNIIHVETNETTYSTTLPTGVYIVNVNSDQGVYNQKIIIQ